MMTARLFQAQYVWVYFHGTIAIQGWSAFLCAQHVNSVCPPQMHLPPELLMQHLPYGL